MKQWITGRNPVYECLRANRRHFFRLLVAEDVQRSGHINEIFSLAEARKLNIEWKERRELLSLSEHNQGIALQVSSYPYAELTDVFSLAKKKNESFFLLLLDQIQDPQNFGTLIRSAELFGVHGIFIPLSRSAGVTPAVVSASSGACEHLLIVQTNIVQAISQIKQRGGWVIGLDVDDNLTTIEQVKLNSNIAIVVGSEGAGLRRLVYRQCDYITRIPTRGRLDSLNAAVAGSIALYAAYLQRNNQ